MKRWLPLALAFAISFGGGAACTSLLGTFETAEGGSGGSGGTGGTTVSSSTTSSTSTPDCSTLECCVADDCPVPGTADCATRVCEGNKCTPQFEGAGTVVSAQTAGDCQQVECDGQGAEVAVPLDTDTFDDSNECTQDGCAEGSPTHVPVAVGSDCTAPGGAHCNAAAECVECTEGAHCQSGVCGAAGACLAASCSDGVKNGDELAVDCGGSCNGCDTGQPCLSGADCYNGVCDSGFLCAAPACDDGVKNGGDYLQNNGETDVDCGGPCGATCGPLAACLANADCLGGECDGTSCIPNCFDTVKNNSETATDCGGGCVGCTQGSACLVSADCGSSFCIDGVCCDTLCDGVCEACTAALKGAGVDGACEPVAGGTDPQDECNVEAPDTCGNIDGFCSGSSGCAKHPLGTLCGDAPSCAAGVQVNQDTCSGTGACVDNGTTPCGLYACDLAACKTSCALDADCASNAYCNVPTSACVLKVANGTACTGANMCTSGFCADGFCCNSSCGGVCRACSNAKSGGPNGTCTLIGANLDPDNECATECNGAGACEAVNGTTCATASICQSGFCVDGVCCNAACSAACQACTAAKNGGVTGTCGNVVTNTDPDNECTTECNGAGACEAANGTACTAASQCQSGFCVDGVCCNTGCTGACQACTAAKTGGATGTCANVTVNTDPDNECTTECNGAGACEATNGTACTLTSQCQSGFCVDGVCCNAACTFSCTACTLAKTGTASGTCANVTAGTDPDVECPGTTNCNGNGQCSLLTQGSVCTLAAECASGFCADGRCCNTACSGLCLACSLAKTGAANGTCANVVPGTDPDNECSTVPNINCAAGGTCGP